MKLVAAALDVELSRDHAELKREQDAGLARLERTADRLRGHVAFALPPDVGEASARDAAAAFHHAAAAAARLWRLRVASVSMSGHRGVAGDGATAQMADAVDAALGAAGALSQLAQVPRLARAAHGWARDSLTSTSSSKGADAG